MDFYERIINDYRQKYAQLEEKAAPGSLERHTYAQIVRFIDETQHITPIRQRAFMLQINLTSLMRSGIEEEASTIVYQCVKDYTRDADLPDINSPF